MDVSLPSSAAARHAAVAAAERVVGPDGIVFEVRPGLLRDAGEALLRILVAPESAGARLLKQNPRRAVYLIEAPVLPALPSLPSLVVKRHRIAGWRDRLRTLVRGSRARAEWRNAVAMHDAGLPVAEPVAFAERKRGAIITEALYAALAVPGAAPLGGYLEARFRPGDGRSAQKRPWVDAAVKLLARVHAAGFDHADFHGGNVLVRDGASAGSAPDPASGLVLIDLHRVARPGAVMAWRRVRSLADLLHTLRFSVGPEDLDAAVASYLAAAGFDRAAAPRWQAAVRARIARREARRVRSRTRRCVHESSAFTCVRTGGVAGFRRREVEVDALFAAVAAARAAIAAGSPEVRSLARRSSVALAACGTRDVAVKVYAGDGARTLRGRLAGRARRAWIAGHGLEVRGVPVPRVLAWLQTPDRAVLVSDAVPDAEPLASLSFRLADGGDLARLLPAATDAVIELLVALFGSGAGVNDLAPKNVLLRRHGRDGERFGAFLVDFDGVRLRDDAWFRREPRRERLLRALAQVNDVDPALPASARRSVLRALRRAFPELRPKGTLRAVWRLTEARRRRTLGA